MTELIDFLLARIEEDAAVARAAVDWFADGPEVRLTSPKGLPEPVGEHIARHDPARVLAECEAKRRIVEAHGSCVCDEWHHGMPDDCPIYRALALPYADHPEFRAEWAL